MRRYILIIMAALLGTAAFAQTITVSGTVKEDSNEPAIGASVIVSGTTNGVVTDINGRYTIKAKKGQVLVFNYLGFKEEKVMLTGQTIVDIKLKPDVNLLDELVVVGYGATKRSDLTGSVASISSDKVSHFQSASVLDALSGQIAGVSIVSTDGTPGAGFDIKIRGVGSINGDASPLYVVDGFQVDNIDYLANSDIESIEFLKDASSSAIYGSRAANGVVLVSTKSGKNGKVSVSYNGSASWRDITKTLDLMTPYEFVDLQMEAWPDKFTGTYYKADDDARYHSLEDYRGVKGVDWQAETFRPSWSHDHNVSVSGGNDNTKYALSFSDYIENGIFTNSSFDKKTAKVRVNQKVSKRVSFDATLNYANTTKKGVGTSGDQGRFNMLGQILRARPTGGLRLTDEELLAEAIDPLEMESSESLSQVNPIVQAQSVSNTRRSEMWSGNIAVSVDFGKGFKLRSAAQYSHTTGRNYIFYNEGSKEAYRNSLKPYGQNQITVDHRWSNFNYLIYTMPKMKGNSLEVTVGHEVSGRNSDYLIGQSTDFPFDALGSNNLGLGATPSKVQSYYADKLLLSFFARANYNYADRFLLTATVRADGSTVFSELHKWGCFPSFSAAWKISNEAWMKNQKTVSSLKLRAGWGMVGNDRISSYLSQELYSTVKWGSGTNVTTGLIPKQLANPDLRWEASQSTNIGIDAGFFKDRLTLTADIFRKDTKDLLMQASIPSTTGFTKQWQNVGKIRNDGLEIALHSVNLDTKGGFFWSTDFNISFIRNEVLAIADGDKYMYTSAGWHSEYKGYDYRVAVGSAIGEIYGYVYDGVYQDSDFNVDAVTGKQVLKKGVTDITDHAGLTAANPLAPGYVKYKDIDGDGKITPNDRTVIGNGTPKAYGGLTNTFAYKGFDLSFMFTFSYGNQIYNATRMFACQSQDQRANMLAEVADRWKSTNASSTVPRWDGYVKNELYSRFVEDGSFFRMKNLTFGYTLPEKLTRKAYISKLRIYVSAQNLFVATKYSGYDPEVSMAASNPMTPGLDWGAYPKSRVVTMGIDLKF